MTGEEAKQRFIELVKAHDELERMSGEFVNAILAQFSDRKLDKYNYVEPNFDVITSGYDHGMPIKLIYKYDATDVEHTSIPWADFDMTPEERAAREVQLRQDATKAALARIEADERQKYEELKKKYG